MNTVVPGEQIGAVAIHKVIDFSPSDEEIAHPTSWAVLAKWSGQERTRKEIRDATRVLALRLIAEKTPTVDLDLSRNEHGAPVLLVDGEASEWNLSMAHSGEWIFMALAKDLSIGVDVEVCRPRQRRADIASMLGWETKPVDDDEFCSRWTLWEASTKCASGSVVSRENYAFDALCDSRSGTVFRAGPWISFWDKLSNVYYAIVMTGKCLEPTAIHDKNSFLAGNG